MTNIGVSKEQFPEETRAALTPGDIPALTKAGLSVVVQAGLGADAGYPDALYAEKGATVVPSREAVFEQADVLLYVRAGGADQHTFPTDQKLLRQGQTVIGFLEPLGEPQAAVSLAETGVTAFSMELMPRISRAQSMDALSAMANIAGYKAVLLAAEHLPKMFPLLMTAAGTITPARVFVIGAGVAGLQAIATAKRLGAKVEAYDVRPVVKDQVESVGASFVELPLETGEAEGTGGYAKQLDEDFYRRQRALMAEVCARNDVVITTAAIPGKPSPLLITKDAVAGMQPASVIIDLAAERGGNCELTEAGKTVVSDKGVTIIGATNLPATVAYHASQMYSRTITTFLRHMVKDGALTLDMEDEIIKDTIITQNGEVVHERVRGLLHTAAPTT
jgi:NAD(P) transhydrogenase subunit alpha